MATLVVVPCGRAKIWRKLPHAGPTAAKAAYTGSPFKVNRSYAEKFADRWVILSAKYGFIDPDFVIPDDYNITFNDPSTHPIAADELRRQVREVGLDGFGTVVSLGGATYSTLVRAAFGGTAANVLSPAAGLPIGKSMARVKKAVAEGRPFQ